MHLFPLAAMISSYSMDILCIGYDHHHEGKNRNAIDVTTPLYPSYEAVVDTHIEDIQMVVLMDYEYLQ
jgi:hypothetical protein